MFLCQTTTPVLCSKWQFCHTKITFQRHPNGINSRSKRGTEQTSATSTAFYIKISLTKSSRHWLFVTQSETSTVAATFPGVRQGSGRGQAGVRQGSGRGHTGVRQGSGRGQAGVKQGSHRGHAGVTQVERLRPWIHHAELCVASGLSGGGRAE